MGSEIEHSAVGKFSFFRSYYVSAKHLENEQRLELYDAMTAYAFEGKEPSFGDLHLDSLWELMKPNIDNSIKGSINGRKGGRPSKYKDYD